MEEIPNQNPQKPLTRRQMLKRGVLSLSAIVGMDAFGLEPNWLRFERIEIPIRGLPAGFDGYRIAVLSDIHYPRGISVGYIQRAVVMANAFAPDLLALPGDFTDRKGSATVPKLAPLFAQAKAKDGIVGTLGNHDHWLDAEGVRRELARNTPVRLIENEAFLVEREGDALAIGGVGDLWEGIVAPEKAFRGVDPSTPRILLSHNPDVAEEMRTKLRVDLQISGHTHGGQVFVPGYGARFVPSRYGNKFRAGLVQGRFHRVYVTSGICSIRNVRFCCRPEVTGIVLRSA